MLSSSLRMLACSVLVAIAACGDSGGTADTDATGSDADSSGGASSMTTTSTTATATSSTTTTATTSTSTTAMTSADATSSDDDATDDGSPMASAGCGNPGTPGASERMIEVAGVMRTFSVTLPDPYDPEVPHPLVFGFHGLGGTGAGYYIPGGLDPAPVIVGPNAEPAGGAWNTTADLEFVDAILDELAAESCLDLTRVFASGYSNGGFMADAVACNRSEVFRGVAVMEGGSSGGFGCGQTAMWIIHNEDDMSVPISYGTALRDQWLGFNGCAATTQPIAPDPPCVVYDGCAAGNPVVWCLSPTGGHNPNYDAALAVPAFFDSL